jgi:hypothetical protein
MLSRSILRLPPHHQPCLSRQPASVLLCTLQSSSRCRRFLPFPSSRVFATTPRHRKDADRIPQPNPTIPVKTEAPESPKAESVQAKKPADASTGQSQDALLAEKVTSRAEQRKADWAIMKEMTRYLWPKDNLGTRFRVGLSVGLLVSAKVNSSNISVYLSRMHELISQIQFSFSTSKSRSTSNP